MEYVNSMNRQALLYIQNVNPELREIHFNDNKISYGKVTIDLGNFNLMTLLSDYSPFKEDVKLMEPQDFINIIAVNVLGQQQLDEENNNLRNSFYDVMDQKPIRYKSSNIVRGYNAFLYDLMCYQDYASSEIKPLLDEFSQKMEEVELDDAAPDIAKRQLQTYYEMQDKALEYASKFQSKQNKKIETQKLQLQLQQKKAGYVNAFSVITSVAMLGMLLASIVLIYLT